MTMELTEFPGEARARTSRPRFQDFIDSASFMMPEFFAPSAWMGHAPFAFWMMRSLRPRSLVELGTHHGFSYLTFCQAIERFGLVTRCSAVDTWKGDDHSGHYGPEVFSELASYHDAKYADFSSLVKTTFDSAVALFPDGSIDLLHLDGCHRYEDTRQVVEQWMPKLSSRGVMVFHDTSFRERNFGVFKVWDELKPIYPSFEFLHGNGLGILGVGGDQPESMRRLFAAASDSNLTDEIRNAYEHLGTTVADRWDRGQHMIELTRIKHLAIELGEIKGSTSWRLTRPLRTLDQNFPWFSRQLAVLLKLSWWILSLRAPSRIAQTIQRKRTRSLVSASGLFHRVWYLEQNRDLEVSNIDPLLHYLEFGGFEGRDPNPLFSSEWYLERNPALRQARVNPLVHYLQRGAAEGYAPGPLFDAAWYTAQNPDVVRNNLNPLVHYWRVGVTDRRPTMPPASGESSATAESHRRPIPRLAAPPLAQPAGRIMVFCWPPAPPSDAHRAPPADAKPQIDPQGSAARLAACSATKTEELAELAKLYGIEGLCLALPAGVGHAALDALLPPPGVQLPYCVCWADGRWDLGRDGTLPEQQDRIAASALRFIDGATAHLRDPRYLRVDGRPLLVVHAHTGRAFTRDTERAWRERCRSAGIGEIFLAGVRSKPEMGLQQCRFDGVIDFTDDPNAAAEPASHPDCPVFRGVSVPAGSQLRPSGAAVDYLRSLESAVSQAIGRVHAAQPRLVFVASWEKLLDAAPPDAGTDFAYLEANRMALLRAGLRASRLPARQPKQDVAARSLAVIVHAFYPDIFADLVDQLAEIHREFRGQIKFFVSAPHERVATIRALLERVRLPYELTEVENRGRDIAPFLRLARQAIDERFDFLLKLHTKKSPHLGDGARWRDDMCRCLATASQVRWIVPAMRLQPHIGIVAPAQFVVPLTRHWERNRVRAQWLANRLGIAEVEPSKEMFVAGTMFFARPAALEPLLNLAIRLEDFEPEDGSVDGTMAHAIERAIAFSARAAGLSIALAQIAPAKEDQMLIPAA
jgi:hypothetical protein